MYLVLFHKYFIESLIIVKFYKDKLIIIHRIICCQKQKGLLQTQQLEQGGLLYQDESYHYQASRKWLLLCSSFILLLR